MARQHTLNAGVEGWNSTRFVRDVKTKRKKEKAYFTLPLALPPASGVLDWISRPSSLAASSVEQPAETGL